MDFFLRVFGRTTDAVGRVWPRIPHHRLSRHMLQALESPKPARVRVVWHARDTGGTTAVLNAVRDLESSTALTSKFVTASHAAVHPTPFRWLLRDVLTVPDVIAARPPTCSHRDAAKRVLVIDDIHSLMYQHGPVATAAFVESLEAMPFRTLLVTSDAVTALKLHQWTCWPWKPVDERAFVWDAEHAHRMFLALLERDPLHWLGRTSRRDAAMAAMITTGAVTPGVVSELYAQRDLFTQSTEAHAVTALLALVFSSAVRLKLSIRQYNAGDASHMAPSELKRA